MTVERFFYSHLLFYCSADKLSQVPRCSGLYFIHDNHKIYAGCAENLQVRMPKSVKRKGIIGRYAFIPIPGFTWLGMLDIEAEVIVSIFSIIYLNRLEERYDIDLLNKTHRHLLPAAAWDPLYAWMYEYQIAVAQTILINIGIPPELVTLKTLKSMDK